MRPGAVLVDVAVDQGGCFEGSRPTTHDDPTFAVHGTTFYCVANMPGAVPVTSTLALTSATLRTSRRSRTAGRRGAEDPLLRSGASTHRGALLNAAVAAAHDLPWTPVEDALPR